MITSVSNIYREAHTEIRLTLRKNVVLVSEFILRRIGIRTHYVRAKEKNRIQK